MFVAKIKGDGSQILWATYVGGSGDDSARGRLTLDAAGNVWVTGQTESRDFPTTSNDIQRSLKGQMDGAIVELSPNGQQLLYSTYIGGNETGSADAAVGGIAVNAAGEAFVCGLTSAPDFPTTSGAFRTTLNGPSDAYVVKIASNGSLAALTLLGGSNTENCVGLALDSTGNPIVIGETHSADFPTTAGAFQTQLKGTSDMFVTKPTPGLSSLVFSTLVGGSGDETLDSDRVELDASGNIYFMVNTTSLDFPVTPNALQSKYGGGPDDVALVKIAADGSQILYSTYLGGSGDDFARSIRYKKN